MPADVKKKTRLVFRFDPVTGPLPNDGRCLYAAQDPACFIRIVLIPVPAIAPDDDPHQWHAMCFDMSTPYVYAADAILSSCRVTGDTPLEAQAAALAVLSACPAQPGDKDHAWLLGSLRNAETVGTCDTLGKDDFSERSGLFEFIRKAFADGSNDDYDNLRQLLFDIGTGINAAKLLPVLELKFVPDGSGGYIADSHGVRIEVKPSSDGKWDACYFNTRTGHGISTAHVDGTDPSDVQIAAWKALRAGITIRDYLTALHAFRLNGALVEFSGS